MFTDQKLNMFKTAILPKLIHRFNAFPYQNPRWLFAEIDKLIWNFVWKYEGPKTILKEKNKDGGLALLSFKTDYKSTATKNARYWHRDRHIDQQNSESRNKIYLRPIDFQHGCQDNSMWEESVFSTNAGTTGHSHPKHNLYSYLTLYIKITSQWIIDLNVSVKPRKLFEKNIRINLWSWVRQWLLRCNTKRKDR